jgi:hypothetical protein
MLKKLIQIAIIFLAVLSVLACEKLTGPSPTEVLNNYLDALYKGRYVESYSYVSVEDKAVQDLKSYLKKLDSPLAKVITSKISYEIVKLEKSDKTATADVEITGPDFGPLFFDVLGAALKSAFGGGGEKEMAKALAKKPASGEVPLITVKQTYQLVKEKDGWKVFLDWKTKKIKEDKLATIKNLMAEAEKLRRSKKLEEVIEKYEKVLELGVGISYKTGWDREDKRRHSIMVDAKEGIRKVKIEIKQIEEKQSYIDNIVLYDLQSRYYETYLGERVPGIAFKIKNKGNRTLKEVEVTVYFKDASGTIIAEKTYHPVLVSKYSFSGDNKPLKPNYIWQIERGEFYKADSVPTEWKEGAVSAKITNIEFAK